MRTLTHQDAGRSLPELMRYVADSGQAVKIIRSGNSGACALIGFAQLESITQQLRKLTAALDGLDEPTRKEIYKALARKD